MKLKEFFLLVFLSLLILKGEDINFIKDYENKNYYIDGLLKGKNQLKDFVTKNLNTNDSYTIFSHGEAGKLYINEKWLSTDELLKWLKKKIKNKKRLNIFACNFAKGKKGEKAIKYLTKKLNIIINASTNITGINGDWVLEVGDLKSKKFKLENYKYNLIDSDGDGIDDINDLDDDNDGIDDLTECPVQKDLTKFNFIEDALQATFHGVIAKTENGYSIWGENFASDGVSNVLIPKALNAQNYGFTGDVLLATSGSNTDNGRGVQQTIVLTTDGLWAFGGENHNPPRGGVLPEGIVSGNAVEKISMPSGIKPQDVKVMHATGDALALLTKNGDIWVLSKDYPQLYGNTQGDINWHKVNTNVKFKNFRLHAGTIFAISDNNTLYTWGKYAYLGDGNGESTITVPTQMTNPLPKGVDIVQIAITGYLAEPTYLLLGSDKKIYTLGEGRSGVLGIGDIDSDHDGKIDDAKTWVNVKSSDSNGVLENVVFISAQDQNSYLNATASAILSDGTLLSWGQNDSIFGYKMLGFDNANTVYPLPKIPNYVSGEKFIYVENGGHITPAIKKGYYCNVGHNEGGAFGDGTTQNRESYQCYSLDESQGKIYALSNIVCDRDLDGIIDSLDLDSDNDGISDLIESGQNYLEVDKNNDGRLDDTKDSDLDGVMDIVDKDENNKSLSSRIVPIDSDSVGVYDYLDLDSDNDGIPDAIEAQATNSYQGNDGNVSDDVDSYGIPPYGLVLPQDTDSDSLQDYIDLDSDNDGKNDINESGLTLSGNDTDKDGIDDSIGASYFDPDGKIDNPSEELLNEIGDKSEVAYREVPHHPVAVDDTKSGVSGKAVRLNTLSVDNTTGDITFSPEDGFTADPTPITYNVKDNTGLVSNDAKEIVDYPQSAPTAVDDTKIATVGEKVVIDVLSNDKIITPDSIKILDENGNKVTELIVPNEGRWYVDTTKGVIVFESEEKFSSNPTPIKYVAKDINGNETSPALIKVIYSDNCLSGKVWYDKNLNGIKDENNKYNVSDIKVTLYTVNENIINSTKTDKNGKYSFCNLSIGEFYKIKVDIPKGYYPLLKDEKNTSIDSGTNKDGWIYILMILMEAV